MRKGIIPSRATAAMICILSVAILQIDLGSAFSKTLQTQNTGKSAPSVEPVQADGGWPRSYVTPTGADVVVYTPQIASWDNQKQLVLYSAVAYTPKGASEPVFGTVKAEAATSVALRERLVNLSVVKITDANFPTLTKDQVQEILTQIPGEKIIWEAPQKAQQLYFIELLGCNVNLGNIAPTEVIPTETMRIGLRGDTFELFLNKAGV